MSNNNLFKEIVRSENTNSFGLYRLYLCNRKGEVYLTHASEYTLRDTYTLEDGVFRGCEMTEKVAAFVDKATIKDVWKE
jgi:hypothetical protein